LAAEAPFGGGRYALFVPIIAGLAICWTLPNSQNLTLDRPILISYWGAFAMGAVALLTFFWSHGGVESPFIYFNF
jgi:nitrogen fixation-related uncharacterized protein